MTVLFERPGVDNTYETLSIVKQYAKDHQIEYVVVASTSGKTALAFADAARQVICVSHHVGFRQPGIDEMGPEMREELRQHGVTVLTTTHLFANVERAITNKFGGLYPGGIAANTLRMFSQGTKVAVEISIMALDAGLVPYGVDIIAVGGSGRGADTALVLRPAHANSFFDTQICDILCKPRFPKG